MAVSVVSFLFSRAAQPEAQGSTLFAFSTASHHQRVSKTSAGSGFPYHILSATSLDSNSSGGPEGPFGLVWLSLPLLVYNSVRSLTVHFLCWPSYILVQRPLNRPLNLWNGMFGCHQFTLFRCVSLWVYHGFYLVPFRQPISAYAISSHNCHWNVSLPFGASSWNGKSKVKIHTHTHTHTFICGGDHGITLLMRPDFFIMVIQFIIYK